MRSRARVAAIPVTVRSDEEASSARETSSKEAAEPVGRTDSSLARAVAPSRSEKSCTQL